MDTRDILITVDIYCEHDWDNMYRAIRDKKVDIFDDETTLLKIETEKYALLAKGYKFLVITDEEYPKPILNSPRPPFVIYYKGDLDTVSERYNYSYSLVSPKRAFVE